MVAPVAAVALMYTVNLVGTVSIAFGAMNFTVGAGTVGMFGLGMVLPLPAPSAVNRRAEVFCVFLPSQELGYSRSCTSLWLHESWRSSPKMTAGYMMSSRLRTCSRP